MNPGTASRRFTPTVNDFVQQYPATTAVFSQFGIDVFDGGASSVQDAAERDGADFHALVGALEAMIGWSTGSSGSYGPSGTVGDSN